MRQGHNQYAPMPGVAELRQAVAAANRRFYGLDIDWAQEVTVTSGGTEAVTACLMAVLDPGDEVVLIGRHGNYWLATPAGLVRFRPDLPQSSGGRMIVMRPEGKPESARINTLLEDRGGRRQDPQDGGSLATLGQGQRLPMVRLLEEVLSAG